MNSASKGDIAFSLVEITLAIGIIGFALLAIVGLIPIGQNSAKEAADDTKTSLIEQDVFARVRERLGSETAFVAPAGIFPNPPTSPSFYYTNEGIFFADRAGLAAALNRATQNHDPLPSYAATVVVGAAFSTALANVSATSLKPVVVYLGYPLDADGNVIGPTVGGRQANAERKSFTFYVRKP